MVVGACLLAVTGLFGGLDQAESTDTVATVPIGTAVDAGPWKVSVDAARVTDALSGVSLEQPDDRWVIVIATIEVFGTSTSNNEVENALELHAVPGIEEGLPGSGTVRAPRLLLARDGLQVDRLEPGLPERVGFFWEQPRAQPIPKTVDVTVLGFTYGKNAFTHIFGWLDPAPVDRVTQVPVEDRTKR